jgi:hypothetical protein
LIYNIGKVKGGKHIMKEELYQILWERILQKYRANDNDLDLDCGCYCNGVWFSLEAIKEIIEEVDEEYYG